MLEAYRRLPHEDQEHLRELAFLMAKRRIAATPANVVLLCDPMRKFARLR